MKSDFRPFSRENVNLHSEFFLGADPYYLCLKKKRWRVFVPNVAL